MSILPLKKKRIDYPGSRALGFSRWAMGEWWRKSISRQSVPILLVKAKEETEMNKIL